PCATRRNLQVGCFVSCLCGSEHGVRPYRRPLGLLSCLCGSEHRALDDQVPGRLCSPRTRGAPDTSVPPSARMAEAPFLATGLLLSIIDAFTDAAGVAVETRDISLAGRIASLFRGDLAEPFVDAGCESCARYECRWPRRSGRLLRALLPLQLLA